MSNDAGVNTGVITAEMLACDFNRQLGQLADCSPDKAFVLRVLFSQLQQAVLLVDKQYDLSQHVSAIDITVESCGSFQITIRDVCGTTHSPAQIAGALRCRQIIPPTD